MDGALSQVLNACKHASKPRCLRGQDKELKAVQPPSQWIWSIRLAPHSYMPVQAGKMRRFRPRVNCANIKMPSRYHLHDCGCKDTGEFSSIPASIEMAIVLLVEGRVKTCMRKGAHIAVVLSGRAHAHAMHIDMTIACSTRGTDLHGRCRADS